MAAEINIASAWILTAISVAGGYLRTLMAWQPTGSCRMGESQYVCKSQYATRLAEKSRLPISQAYDKHSTAMPRPVGETTPAIMSTSEIYAACREQ